MIHTKIGFFQSIGSEHARRGNRWGEGWLCFTYMLYIMHNMSLIRDWQVQVGPVSISSVFGVFFELTGI